MLDTPKTNTNMSFLGCYGILADVTDGGSFLLTHGSLQVRSDIENLSRLRFVLSFCFSAFSLEGSGISFADLFRLIAFYCISR